MNAKEKQNQSLVNTLITISESSARKSEIPSSKRKKETVKEVVYRVLKENPYTFKQYGLFYEVHINQLKKDASLKLTSYMLAKSELCAIHGWGIHGNEEGKLALVPAESEEYRRLYSNPRIKKIKAYNKSK